MILTAIRLTPTYLKYQVQIEKQEHPGQTFKNILRALRTTYYERKLHLERLTGKKIEFNPPRGWKS